MSYPEQIEADYNDWFVSNEDELGELFLESRDDFVYADDITVQEYDYIAEKFLKENESDFDSFCQERYELACQGER